ncbi:N-acyl-phosphatidylethanolamine-hydrolyzing phospholipase d [Plakobranchus ocellatus]|uniref:N-acetylphosphatidylethanolamine-hydrolyzing phospholipase D n=1 Tax=Plakobranchus ocellatus TaxID=259542 RepID=A0AAV4C810_9GAST|nr:N-acyl-phosphatidylethanolamine-hydrolyzing phospholipase d [Plakobranchus ocellatus]
MADHSQSDENTTDALFTPCVKNGRYNNPWKTWSKPQFSLGILKFFFGIGSEANVPKRAADLDKTLPVIKPDFAQFATSPASGIRHMWIGHASSLVQFDGLTFLTDPVFSDRCAPVQFAGPKRYRPPPCTIEELPKIDCVFISHNHYDHLDYYSVVQLNRRFGDDLRWYVPQGMKKWMNDQGCKNVVELSWWNEHIHSSDSGFKMVSTPCQHWSKRTLRDDNMALWSSWCVLGPKHRFYFSGDTGYCATFSQIGQKYGPFTLATIPIGAYNPRWFLKPQHVDPGEAVMIHREIKAQKSIGIHWGTFTLSFEHYLEPREKLAEEAQKQGLKKDEFVTVAHGEVKIFGAQSENS